jgi:hypothetical protein
MSEKIKFKDLFAAPPKRRINKKRAVKLPPSKTGWWKKNGSWVEINKIGEKTNG